MHVFNTINRVTYRTAVEAGYIKVQSHPDIAGYTIHNYTDACTWDQAWDEATLNCRGLITDDDGNIIARGMPKFFNSDQEQAPKFSLEDEVFVSDKMDGSLGILYKLPDGTEAIATRGSFASEQAIWATKWWIENRPPLENFRHDPLVAGGYFSMDEWTFVFEIIYPENRIVVDYNGKEGLVLLGIVRNEDGLFQPLGITGVDSAPRYSYETWGEVLSAPERANAEGFVISRISDAAMVKVKYEDYKRLHKYMTRVTERHVWECLMEERSLEAEFAGAPDEFHVWIRGVADRLWAEFEKRHLQIILDYRAIRFGKDEALFEVEDDREAKKNFALAVKAEKDKAYYFTCFGDGSIAPAVWKELKPLGGQTFRVVSSDAD
jgi:RNA ligase